MNNKIQKNISILLVSTSYPRDDQDWRGRFIADMVSALSLCSSITVKTWMPPGNLPPNVSNAALPSESQFLAKLIQQGGIAYVLRAEKWKGILWIFNLIHNLRSLYQREKRVDGLHINWLQNAIPLWGMKTPALVTVLGTDYKLMDLPGMTPLLKRIFRQRKCIIAPNADWMRISLEERFGDVAEIRTIPFGVHARWFEIRRELPRIHFNRWITVSRLTRNKIGPLFEWGEGLFGTQHQLNLLGPNQDHLSVPEWIIYSGAASPSDLIENYFPASAGLITLSQHDEGRPQVILEAMAAGVPVIASNLTAHRDVIAHRKTGWIVNTQEDLQEAISFLSIPQNNIQLGNAAKEWIKEHIGTWEDSARRYESAYADLLNQDEP